MQFEYDPERLIEEVKKRPGIWDFENLDYRTKNIRHKLWTEVVKELLQANVKVTKSELRELELQLQKKWKSIRDCFQKYVTNPNRTRRPYIYCKQLQFLLKDTVIPAAKSSGGESSDSDGAKYGKRKSTIWRHRAKIKLVKNESSGDEDNTDHNNYDPHGANSSNEDELPIKVAKHNKDIADDFVFATVDSQGKNESEDPDKLFLLSLLPHLKSVPEEFKLNVKMDMMQVLQNASYNVEKDHNKLI